MKMKYVLGIMAAAWICLLAASAIDTPGRSLGGAARNCAPLEPLMDCLGDHIGGAWMLLVDDATKDNFQNMTLAQIDSLKEEKMAELQNMTPAQIDAIREEKLNELRNTTLSEFKDCKKDKMGWMRPEVIGHPEMRDHWKRDLGMTWMLLVDEVRDNLKNMTKAQIEALKEQKMAELQNMTLAEIDALRQQKWQEMQNTTLSELREQGLLMCKKGGAFGGPNKAWGPNFRL